ncbi:hypothetical protein JW962_02835 [Candidatus Dojkabacteria bacterium]|nr:hypothetical protein [Candidatus Dojkabacteria bacterium]
MEKEREFEKEEQEVLSFLENPAGSSTPDSNFSNSLKQSFLKKAGIFNFSLGEIMKKSLKYAIIGVASVIVLVGGFFTYKALWPKPTDPLANIDLQALLRGAIKNNNLSRQGGTQALATGLKSTNEESADLAAGYGWYDNSTYINFNYSHDIITTERGPKSDSCPVYVYYPGEKTITETYSFWDDSGYKSKTVTKTGDGELIAYYQSDESSNFTYFGGNYAIRETYDYSDRLLGVEPAEPLQDLDMGNTIDNESTKPLDSENTSTDEPESFIDSYFGTDVKAVAYETINDQNYVVIEFKWDDFYCGSDSNSKTVYTRQWINEQTYEIYKEEMYLDSVATSNLISTTIYAQENQSDIAWDTVSSKFANDYLNVSIHEYVYEYTSGIDETEVNAFLAANNFSIIVPNGYVTNGFYLSYEEEQDYPDYCDRALYPDTEIGRAMYNQSCELYSSWYQPDYVSAIASGDYNETTSRDGTNISIATYDNSVREEQILDSTGLVRTSTEETDGSAKAENGFTKTGTKTLTIDGTSVAANVYVSEQTYYEITETVSADSETEGNDPVKESTTKTYKAVMIMFRYKNALHIISADNYSDDNFDAETFVYPAFTSYSTLNTTGRAKILELTTSSWAVYEEDIPDEAKRQ